MVNLRNVYRERVPLYTENFTRLNMGISQFPLKVKKLRKNEILHNLKEIVLEFTWIFDLLPLCSNKNYYEKQEAVQKKQKSFFHKRILIFLVKQTTCSRIYEEQVQTDLGPKLNLKNIWKDVLAKKLVKDDIL